MCNKRRPERIVVTRRNFLFPELSSALLTISKEVHVVRRVANDKSNKRSQSVGRKGISGANSIDKGGEKRREGDKSEERR